MNIIFRKNIFLVALLFFVNIFSSLDAYAKEESNSNNNESDFVSLSPKLTSQSRDFYLLGPGDILSIRFDAIEEVDEFKKTLFPIKYKIDVDGNLFLPRLKKVYAEGLTVNELTFLLIKEYGKIMRVPNLTINIEEYRDISVYVLGELSSPGYYELKRNKKIAFEGSVIDKIKSEKFTLFDAIREAGGITPYSRIDNIKIVRKLSRLSDSPEIHTRVDLMSTLVNGDSSQNIKLYDQDQIFIERSESILREQYLKAAVSNMNPQSIKIFVSGRVRDKKESYILPKATTLNQAINVAGGIKPISGRIDFLRLTETGIEKRKIAYNSKSKSGSYRNPFLKDGDIIRVNDSLFSNVTEVLTEVTRPAISIFAIDELFNN